MSKQDFDYITLSFLGQVEVPDQDFLKLIDECTTNPEIGECEQVE